MTDLRAASEMALEALEGIHVGNMTPMAEENWNKAIAALRTALAQPEHTSATIQRAESVVSKIRQRNEKTWDELEREAVFAINGLVAFAKFQFGRADPAPPSKPDDLLRQSEQEGWRWAKECEAEVKRLRTLLAEGGQGCGECGVKASDGYALYCVNCVEPFFKKEWVSLTDDDIALLRRQGAHSVSDKHFKATEALLKEKNT